MSHMHRHGFGKTKDKTNPRYMRAKDKLRVSLFILLGVLVFAFLIFMLSQWESSYYGVQGISESINSWQLFHRTLEVDGTKYRERSGLESYLIMGVDTEGEMGKMATGGAGQADMLMLIVIDNQAETWRLLQINRDSMVDFSVLGINGQVVKTRTAQLALSYAYGDGGEGSCENTVEAVSNLLKNQKINGYAATNIDSIAYMTDLLGGVTVTLPDDYSSVKEGWTKGTVVTLTGEEAELVVRKRYDIGDRTNLTRMERQLAFWDPFSEKILNLKEEELENFLENIEDKVLTNITLGVASRICNKLSSYTNLGVITIDGENELLDENWAYYLDENSVTETVLTLFFQKL